VVSNVKVHVVKRGIRQKDIASMIGVTEQQMSNWVNGKSIPPLKTALLLARLLETTVDSLWYIEE